MQIKIINAIINLMKQSLHLALFILSSSINDSSLNKSNSYFLLIILLSLTMWVEKLLFWSKFFEIETLIDLYFLRSPESENHIFSGCSFSLSLCLSLSLSVRVCLCSCYWHSSKTNNSSNSKFGMVHLYHMQMLLETFYENRANSL